MSVYLSRSPYYLNSKRAGSVRRRSSQRKFNNGLKALQIKKFMIFGARKTGAALASGARSARHVASAFRNVDNKKLSFNFGPSAVIIGLFGLTILFGLGYLANFNQVTTKGYDLRRLEANRQQLLNEYEVKNMKLAEAASMNTIIHSEKADTMHRVNSVTYISSNTVLASL